MKGEATPRVVVLVLVALAIWGYNAREIFVAEGADEETNTTVRQAGDAEIRARMQVIAKSRPAERLEPVFDPFTGKRLVAEPPKPKPKPKPKPRPEPVPKKETKPKPPPFLVRFVGYVEGNRKIMIFLERGEVILAEVGDWIGVWKLVSEDRERLVFEDANGNRHELAIGAAE